MNKRMNHHDTLFRDAMAHREVARGFFEQHLPSKLLNRVDLNTLELQKDTYIEKQLKTHCVDMLFNVKSTDNDLLLYILAEHQSTPDRWMPLRMLQYKCAIMRDYIKRHKGRKKLPLIYDLVFYNGERQYSYSTDIHDLIDAPADLTREVLLTPFKLVDVNEIDDEQMQHNYWSGIMQFMMKYARKRDFLQHLERATAMLYQIETNCSMEFFSSIITYIFYEVEDQTKQDVISFFEKLNMKKGEKMGKTIAEQLLEEGAAKGKAEGIAEGIAEGEQQGIRKGARAVAKNLLNANMSPDFIANMTGLSITEVKKIASKLAEKL